MNIDEHLGNLLSKFDKLDLENEYDRRLAIKPLYDFYQISLLEASVMFCGFNRDTVKNQHLNTRWMLTRSTLLDIDSTIERWNNLIKTVENERNGVEHNDYHFPKKEALVEARLQASDFLTWLVTTSKNYYELSRGFSFAKEFTILSDIQIILADIILNTYSEKTPFFLDSPEEKAEFWQLPQLKERLEPRSKQIRDINDLKKEDLIDLITLAKLTENINVRENALLHDSKCPNCGNKIITTEEPMGGNEADSAPEAIAVRVGCEKCDYSLHEETIDI